MESEALLSFNAKSTNEMDCCEWQESYIPSMEKWKGLLRVAGDIYDNLCKLSFLTQIDIENAGAYVLFLSCLRLSALS